MTAKEANAQWRDRSARWWGLGMLACLVSLWGLLWGPIAGAVWPLPAVAAMGVYDRWRQQQQARREELTAAVEFLEAVATDIRAGGSFSVALRAGVGATTTTALASRFSAARESLSIGRPLEEVLGRVDSTELPLLELTLVGLRLLCQHGGAAVTPIDRMSDVIRSHEELRAEADIAASQARASARLMALLPLVFGGLVAIVSSDVRHWYLESFLGACVVVLAAALAGMGWLWSQWLVQRHA